MTQHRSSLYTRTGDMGNTGLFGGERLHKDHDRVHAIGDVDELNCQVGVARAACRDEAVVAVLGEIQRLLFELGAEIAQPMSSRLSDGEVERLEQLIDRFDQPLPPLRQFIFPGGESAATQCHLARAICRRAERNLFRLARTEDVNSATLQFINRLSDLLFVLARSLNHRAGVAEEAWTPATEPKENQA